MGPSVDDYRFFLGIVRETDNLEDPRLEEWLILKWSFRKWNVVM